MSALAVGDTVRVRDDWPEARGPAHIRTPHYLRGRTGRVVRRLGAFASPEELAFNRPAPVCALYHVAFAQPDLWPDGRPDTELLVELFDFWLEPP